MKLKTVPIAVMVKLNRYELAEKGEELARLELDYADLMEAKAKTMGEYKQKLDGIAAGITGLCAVIVNGEELKQLNCRMLPDFDSGAMKFLHPDKDEVMSERAMTADELQGNLPIGEEN